MDPTTIYIIFAVLSIPAAMLGTVYFFGKRRYLIGIGWVNEKTPDTYDWILSFLLASMLCFPLWPALLAYGTAVSIGNKETRKEETRKKKARKQAQAFKQMKEAQKCISQAKQDAYRLDTKQWELAFHEADTKHREEREAEHRRWIAESVARRNAERIERERMYSDARGYGDYGHSGLIYCQHGNSIDYPCSLCLF